MVNIARKDKFLIGASILLGACVSTAAMWAICLSVVQPALAFHATGRRACFLSAAGFYLAAIFPLLRGAADFFGPGVDPLSPLAVWAAASLLLSLPFVAWGDWRRAVIPISLLAVPPLGLISWASPLTASGLLFPGFGAYGLVICVVLMALLCARLTAARLIAAATIVLLSVGANVAYKAPAAPDGWIAVSTHQLPENLIVAEYKALEDIQGAVAANPAAHVLVFPEAHFPNWVAADERFPGLQSAATAGKTIVSGATILPVHQWLLTAPPPTEGRPVYRNVVLSLSADGSTVYDQRVPVPVGMWHLDGTGVKMRLSGASVLNIAGQRAGTMLCYETLLPFEFLSTMAEKPTVLLGLANDYWARGTSIPAWQAASLRCWARLFHLPYLFAANT